MSELILTDHALIRYIQRFRPDLLKQVVNDIQEIADNGVYVKKRSGELRKTRYLRHGKKILVISRDNKILTTLSTNKNYKRVKKHERPGLEDY